MAIPRVFLDQCFSDRRGKAAQFVGTSRRSSSNQLVLHPLVVRLLLSAPLCDIDPFTCDRHGRVSHVTRVAIDVESDRAAPGAARRQHTDPAFVGGGRPRTLSECGHDVDALASTIPAPLRTRGIQRVAATGELCHSERLVANGYGQRTPVYLKALADPEYGGGVALTRTWRDVRPRYVRLGCPRAAGGYRDPKRVAATLPGHQRGEPGDTRGTAGPTWRGNTRRAR